MPSKGLSFLASPWRATEFAAQGHNKRYARKVLRHAIFNNKVAVAPHLLYPQVLVDGIETERRTGLDLCKDLLRICDELCIYIDLGISPGMEEELKYAKWLDLPIVYYSIEHWHLPRGHDQWLSAHSLDRLKQLKDSMTGSWSKMEEITHWHSSIASQPSMP